MQKNSFDKLITHLIVIDTLLVIFFVIDAFTENVIGYEPQYYKVLYPYVLHPGKAISLSSSIFMVVVVAADRQRAICHPMLYRVSTFGVLYLTKIFNYVFFPLKMQPSPRIFTYCVLMATTLNNLPRFFEFQLIFDEKGTDYWTSDINEDPRYITMSSYNELITTGFFPLLALCYYNYKIYARMKLSCNIDLGRYVGGKFLLKNIKMHQEGKSISF